MTVAAIDVGGTTMKCAVVDASCRARHRQRHPTGRERGPQAVLEAILDVAVGLTKQHDVRALGVVVPGVIVDGVVRFSANLGFRDVHLRDLLQDRLGIPVVLGHDVRAGGLAEARLGAGQGLRHVLFVPIGTGIAAAHVVDGVVAAGAHGAAGEIGHIVVRPGGPPCACGSCGCLEAVASASALQRRYLEATGTTTTAAAIAGILATDATAARIWDEAVDALADGLLIGQALYDVEIVVVGGGLAESGELLLTPLREVLRRKASFHRVPAIEPAQLGDEAGCIGAALLAMEAPA